MDTLYSRRLQTPIGGLTLFSRADGALLYIAFDAEEDAEVTHLRAEALPDDTSAPEAARQLQEYFAGQRTTFDVPLAVTGENFSRRAQQAMGEIPFGQTLTYTRLAEIAGNPDAIRAAGSACARNPLPIIWACHRVVRSDGSWGAYRGGPEAKTWLLNFEAGNLDAPSGV